MTDRRHHVAVLGGGPAGLGAALGLARRGFGVTVVEARESVGGNAGSFEVHGIQVDYGSHRLHPATRPEILSELKALLGPDLLVRPRHGRIRLGGRWIHFPLRPLDLALHAPPAFKLGVARDLATRALRAPKAEGSPGEESFASVLLRGLGPTVCEQFYFPYARKIWGLEPEELSPIQARKRVAASSLGLLLRRLLPGRGGGGGRSTRGVFYYPRKGYGQISEALATEARRLGADILTETRVLAVTLPAHDGPSAAEATPASGGPPLRAAVEVEDRSGRRSLACDRVWSTIPVGPLVGMVSPPAPARVREAAASLEQRAMLLVYVVLGTSRFTEYDAHYFPGPDVPMTRLSEPKNYAGRVEPSDRTVLCAEVPCSTSDPVWSADDAALVDMVVDGLARADLPVDAPVIDVHVRRLGSAYPLYRAGYEEHLDLIDGWLEGLPGLLTFGRQGLFAHDNTHHALDMARAAVECLDDDGAFDHDRWAAWREVFATHVVED